MAIFCIDYQHPHRPDHPPEPHLAIFLWISSDPDMAISCQLHTSTQAFTHSGISGSSQEFCSFALGP